MSALTSLLVRDQVVTVRKIEAAIQRQVIGGGDLESILLEMGLVEENVLSAYRAALFGLLPATRDEVMNVPADVARLVPREVAEQYRLLALSSENRVMVVAVSTPLSGEVDEQLSFLLGHDLVYRVVTDMRVAIALSAHHSVPLPTRLERLAGILADRNPGTVPYVRPPKDNKLEGAPAVRPKSDTIDWEDQPAEERPSSSQGTPPGPTAGGVVVGVAAAARLDEAASMPAEPTEVSPEAVVVEPYPEQPARPSPWDDGEATDPGRSAAPEALPEEQAEPAVAEVGTAEPAQPEGGTPSGVVASAGGPRQGARRAVLRKLRGAITAKKAVDALSEATDRDEIVTIFLLFARQFFDFTAVLTLSRDHAVVRETDGGAGGVDGAEVEIRGGSTLEALQRAGTPIVTDFLRNPADAPLIETLGRSQEQPAAIYPVTLRGRPVLLAYGDRSGEPLSVSDLPELTALLPRVGEALEALIRKRKKTQGYGASSRQDRSSLKSAGNRVSAGTSSLGGSASDSSGRNGRVESPEGYLPSSEPTHEERERGSALGVLGVPRSAPPPPSQTAQALPAPRIPREALSEELFDESEDEEHERDPGDETLDERLPSRRRVKTDPDGVPAALTEPAPPPSFPVTGYSIHDAGQEVLSQRPADGSADTPAAEGTTVPASRGATGAASQDARSEGPGRVEETVRVPSSISVPESSTSSSSLSDTPSDPVASDPAEAPEETKAPSVEPPRPRRRRLSPSTGEAEPSVIVDMGDGVEALVDDLIECGPDDEGPVVTSLLSVGEAALPALVQRFPGPLWFDRHRPHRRLPRGRDVSAIARSLAGFGERAVPYAGSLLRHRDPDVRFYATLLCAELLAPELLPPLAERVFDEDPGTQVLALDVLRRFSAFPKPFEETLKTIRLEARAVGRDPFRRRTAARALGELRDARSLEILIDLLGSSDPELVDAGQRALVTLTRQDFGLAPRRWIGWAERNGSKHRIEWLIDGLLHADEALRSAAADELKTLTQEYYGYHPASPKKDREVAQRKYRSWWEQEGQYRFAS